MLKFSKNPNLICSKVNKNITEKMTTDTVGNLLTKIRNASRAGHRFVTIPFSAFNLNIVRLLTEEKYLYAYTLLTIPTRTGTKPVLLLVISSLEGTARITHIKRISKPSCRVYARAKNIPKVLGGYGTVVISTSKGLVTSKSTSIKEGGELLFSIW
jgi:small subunit ribosomal protein S8